MTHRDTTAEFTRRAAELVAENDRRVPEQRTGHDGAVTLTEFLLARIAEDEGTALYAQTRDDLQPEDWGGWWFGHHQHYSRYTPARVLAECEAKRRIVEGWADPFGTWRAAEAETAAREKRRILRLLALPYAGHPDYREEWKP